MTDQDIENLEAYLDDALSEDDAQALRRRLAGEPELAGRLADLREQRAARHAVWAVMEPDAAGVSRLVERVGRSVDRRLTLADRFRTATRGLAAAAVFVLGLGVGMYVTAPSDPGVNLGAPMMSGGDSGGPQLVTGGATDAGGVIVRDADGRLRRFANEADARAYELARDRGPGQHQDSKPE